MNSTEYEHLVAAILHAEGWDVHVTPPSGDGGLDVIAESDGRRLGVQVKMYGTGRKVNRQVIHELFGAGSAEGCTEFMVATDGAVSPDARAAADILGVMIRVVPSSGQPQSTATSRHETSFESVWLHVARLEGSQLKRASGKTNEIVSVDGGGVRRVTSGGTSQLLPIELFRWAIERLLAGDVVTLAEINHQFTGRGSSGIVLILGSLPMFETFKQGRGLALRLASGASTADESGRPSRARTPRRS